jgi:hypothetical protein
MTEEEHLISVLIEECAEVTQACCKALRFGLDDFHPVTKEKNRDYIAREMADLDGAMGLLRYTFKIIPINDEHIQMIDAKKRRVLEYMEYARNSGALCKK